jgi:hypothetical protein
VSVHHQRCVRSAVQGQVLNETSAWWMGVTRHIVPNALLDVPDPNVSVMRKCTVFPVEFVVRGFMTGAPSKLGMRTLRSLYRFGRRFHLQIFSSWMSLFLLCIWCAIAPRLSCTRPALRHVSAASAYPSMELAHCLACVGEGAADASSAPRTCTTTSSLKACAQLGTCPSCRM